MNKKLRVLMTGYEIAPFYKFGGMGDVMGSLPKALKEVSVDCRVVIPYYQEIREKFKERKIGEFFVHFGESEEEVSVYEGYFGSDRVVIYFLSNRPNLSHIKTHGRNKKIDQFAFFDLALAHFILWLKKHTGWTPSLVHCNDWHTALIPLILKKQVKLPIPTLLTIHNLSYQGWGTREVLNLLHLQDEDVKELKKNLPATEINVLGEGIMHATRVSTVSKTYAQEISHPNHKLISKYIQKRESSGTDGKITGILNGIDYGVWDPTSDPFITRKFNSSNWESNKKKDKEDLLKKFNLPNLPVFCFVGRITTQKVLNIIVKTAKKLIDLDINIIILGSGEPNIEKSVKKIENRYPSNIKTIFSYNEELAHKIYAGSDFILIPSHFEPCGLIQMIAMRYGTLPIASNTGGLKDSIKNNSTGFLFEKDKTRPFIKAVKKALMVYKDSQRPSTKLVRGKYEIMVKRAMNTDFTWKKSAKKYKKLYLDIVSNSHFNNNGA